MSPALPLLGYAAVVGLLAPGLLLRRAWPYRAPALAVAVWQGLIVSFVLAVALAAHHLAAPTEHLHADLVGFLHWCGLTATTGVPDPTITDRLTVALPLMVVAAALAAVAVELFRGRRARARHRRVLDLVGRRDPRLAATVVEHERPAVYCLPGRRPRIVVSAGALRLLSPGQLDAVLAHERAHIAGRHHLALAVTEAFARLCGWLPLARHAREQTAVLLEMAADDRALDQHSPDLLATAMYEMAAARSVPPGAFAMGGPSAAGGGAGALVRLRRVLHPQRRPHPVLRAALAVGAALPPVIPLLFGCVPTPFT
ncbi:M56 family metallopeptidase [Streptomyces sp. NPDC004610]|uniref:M56 family metallopeptidase n=1 Tax=unclassified Streptomyces TaxID=2593676 RepID=UPI0033B9502A